jgi:hypothetical protein
LSRIEEDGRKWLGRPKLCTKSCRAVLRRRICILALVIRHANSIFCKCHYIVICGPSGRTILFHILSSVAYLVVPYCSTYCHLWPVWPYHIVPHIVICGPSGRTILFHILSSVACLAVPYCSTYSHLWPVWLYHIVPHYLINCTISEKKF